MAELDPAIQETGVLNYFVYILASKRNGTLYIGVTNDLARRVFEHKQGTGSVFTTKYGVNMLVHAEVLTSPQDAIQRETNLKRWPRKWKLDLIEKNNPDWIDLYETLA
jgi:putative endonuclease